MNRMVTLYTRHDCPLCGKLAAKLELFRQRHPFNLKVVDIDEDLAKHAKYNYLVPLLVGEGDREISRYLLDRNALQRYLDA